MTSLATPVTAYPLFVVLFRCAQPLLAETASFSDLYLLFLSY
jgi:hypothetical protein